jgi:hypothetical protein
MTESSVTPILERLKQPLENDRVKWREGAKGEHVPYLEGHDMITTANDIFEFRWSFDIGEPQVRQWQRMQMHWDKQQGARIPTLDQAGQPLTEQVGIVWVTGRVTIHLEDIAYVHADIGRCTFTGDSPDAFDTAISGCVTDCLKRCLRQMGKQFGNELYNKAARPELAQACGIGTGKKPARQQPALETSPLTLEQAKSIPCPLGAKSHPEYKGLILGQVLTSPDGVKVLEYLTSDQYRPNGDKNGHRAKAAAKLLLDSLQPA